MNINYLYIKKKRKKKFEQNIIYSIEIRIYKDHYYYYYYY